VAKQTWNSPASAESPPAWHIEGAPPAWFADRATEEGWPPDAIETWRAELLELGVRQVALTLDIRGATIEFGRKVAQGLNPDNAQPLHSALGRGVDRLRAISKARAGDNERRTARQAPPD
jgi:hypothetical protein